MDKKMMGGTLLIRTSGDRSNVEISGTKADILFNWTALTHQICKTAGIPPIALAAMLPQLVSDYQQHSLKDEVRMERKAEVYEIIKGAFYRSISGAYVPGPAV